jgi:thiamine-phosphate pyrophosphorylase
MAEGCLLYYITDRTGFAADEPTRRKRVLEKIAEVVRAGIDYIQLREKDMPTRELESLACEAVALLKELKTENRELRTALLINSRTDIAVAVGADGIHLRSDDISPQEVGKIWRFAASCGTGVAPGDPLIAVSCHSPKDVQNAAAAAATFAVFAPVFEKKDAPGSLPAGLAQLEQACRASIPVLALGGVNLENAQACLERGAAGVAAIRLFQENNVADIVKRIRDT